MFSHKLIKGEEISYSFKKLSATDDHFVPHSKDGHKKQHSFKAHMKYANTATRTIIRYSTRPICDTETL